MPVDCNAGFMQNKLLHLHPSSDSPEDIIMVIFGTLVSYPRATKDIMQLFLW